MSETAEAVANQAKDDTDPVQVAADLKRRLADATAARQAAETRASTAETAAAEARRHAVHNGTAAITAQADAVSNGIVAGEARMAALKRDMASAMAAGEYEKAAEAQAEMAEIGGSLYQLRAQKQAVEDRRQQALREPPKPAFQAPASDPTEAFIASRTPRTQEWLRKNKEVAFQNGQLSRRLQAAHLIAEDEGCAPDTDAYFSVIEKHMGMNKQAEPPPPPRPQRNGATSAAPPSRGADYGGGEQKRSGSGYISPDVVERAKWMGISPQELQAGIDETERSSGFLNGNPYGRR